MQNALVVDATIKELQMEYTTDKKRAKFRFVALYVLGLVLIFILVSSFWQKRLEDVKQSKLEDAIRVADEKDKVIASLQTQLKEKEAALQSANAAPAVVTSNSTGDGEWKQKYAALKSSYEKVSANEKALKSAYKTVVDDNKRLLTQLQSIKKD